ncbi:von Willebrand factor A domain-containing protein 9 [Sinocyclocheilus anshuiensis]|uniref:Integrator complex subunit 14 n=1 Tax=Sinocyclocheilus anshuiensis TaxID=1608454 RepID=A0A671ME90_9TELE|nr:PREDICTED: von Willebrand factor A domain-containing protein 9 [Sinocyclocheilus anshuiensis]XP_016320918.1 PREDICTED: von Willebrand factor A domain-containing protein 9 [Sinocyclocheilus anshuiensis]XP_016320919.1 PREDICTED: von Willebrand factor A domain-containing protein 9 [Sinocyclocheilus anshuiensis]XP_016320920.1 PREDICTED: von Willebrand factor A domain-containing protein 9 [Sinocyclocheilus anshuiensis]
MPTVVLMDSSLSMTRPVSVEGSEEFQRKNLAVHGLTMLFEHMATNYRLEFTSLVAFSSLWELMVPFSRDYNTLQEALNNLEDFDKTCLEAALQGVSNVVQQEWGTSCPCQVVLVTDGALGIGRGSLRHSLQTVKQRMEDKKFPLPFPFPSKLYVMCIANAEELQATDSMDNLEQLIHLNGGEGQIYTMEGPLCLKSVQSMFSKLIDQAYSPFHAVLRCGNLTSDVQVFPRPEPVTIDEEVDPIPKTVQTDLEIVGFIEIGDISSPPVLSRHLVLPMAVNKEVDEIGTGATDDTEEETSTNQMAGKSPNFCVLLHGSLKVEGMVALVQLGPDWLGMLYSQADSKKKSNLMMSLFEPGSEPLPWLGRMSQLGPASDAAENPYGEDDSKSPFPIQPKNKRSYAQNVTVWIKASGLQTDVQKILRNARKLPEKTQTFYKELNRLRKAALAFGFWELLKSVAELLERECTLLPDSAHPDAAFQLSHAAQQLKLASSGDSKYAAYEHNITPMLTDFSGGGGADRI